MADMVQKGKSGWIVRIVIYALFFIVSLYLAYCTPYCHDEWKWGLPMRWNLMKEGFRNYNGRILGNLFAILITRSRFWKAVLPALWMVWLLAEMEYCLIRSGDNPLSGKGIFLLFSCIFLIGSVPQALYAQSYGWLAAFVNFVCPAALFLLYFAWTEDVWNGESGAGKDSLSIQGKSYAALKTVAALAAGIAVQLFAEHTTIFVLFYAILVLVVCKIRKRRIQPYQAGFLAGAAAGAVLMFSNSAYRGVLGHKGFKSVSLSVSDMYYKLRDEIVDDLFIKNWLLNTILVLLLMVLLIRSGKRTFRDAAAALIMQAFSVYSIFHKVYPDWIFVSDEGNNNTIILTICALFFISVCWCIWRVCMDQRGSIMILYLSFAVVAASLMAANPIGERCFYFSYILECVAVLKILMQVLKGIQLSFWYPSLIALCTVLVLGTIYIRMFTSIRKTDEQRQVLIEEAVASGASEVTLPYLPYGDYCWTTAPVNDTWTGYFKEFYGIPEEMDLTFQ